MSDTAAWLAELRIGPLMNAKQTAAVLAVAFAVLDTLRVPATGVFRFPDFPSVVNLGRRCALFAGDRLVGQQNAEADVSVTGAADASESQPNPDLIVEPDLRVFPRELHNVSVTPTG